MGQRKYKNILKLKRVPDPIERRENLVKEVLKDSTPLPQTLEYVDIDKSFKDWVESELAVTFEDKEIPTVALFSSQRFSEYMESWQNSDDHKNMMMNFKVITRENNPKPGTLHGGNMNIPGEPTFLMKRVVQADKNGRPYFLDYRMKQPFCVDLIYTVSLVTNKYQLLNEFNMMIIKKFDAIQAYIRPNGHFLPMKLENISDESEYSMDDRQYFSQSFEIRVMAYIIQSDDLVTEERPIIRYRFGELEDRHNGAYVEMEELDPCESKYITPYYYQPVVIRINFEGCDKDVKFKMVSNFVLDHFEVSDNVKCETPFRIWIDDTEIDYKDKFSINEGSTIRIFGVNKYIKNEDATIEFYGYNPDVVYDEREDKQESALDETQKELDLEISTKDTQN